MQPDQIIDGHLHLDDAGGVTAAAAVDLLAAELAGAGIGAGFVLHLDWQPWSLVAVADALRSHDHLLGFANVPPDRPNAEASLRTAVGDLGYRGLKLHPRFGGYSLADTRTISLVRTAGALGVPVIVDAFPDGDWLLRGQGPIDVARLALAAPDTTVVAAHMGGHQVLDMLMLAKRVSNLWLDFSFSHLYYAGSSVVDDLFYALKSLRYERVYYGSDHPDRPAGHVLEATREMLVQRGVGAPDVDRLLWGNAARLLEVAS